MRWTSRLLTVLATATLVLTVVLPAFAQEAYKLRRAFKVNEIRLYKTVVEMNGEIVMGQNTMPLNMQMVTVYREKVAGIKEGKATIHTSYESFKMYMNGQEFSLPDMPNMRDVVVTTVIDERNRVYEVRGLERLQGSNPFGNLNFGTGINTTALFPEEPIKVGDTWQTDFPLAKAKETGLVMKHTFVSVANVGGVQAAVIRSEFEGPYEQIVGAVAAQANVPIPPVKGTMKVVVNSYFDLATGNLLKSDGDMVMSLQFEGGGNNPMMPQQGMQMNMSVKMAVTEEKPPSK